MRLSVDPKPIGAFIEYTLKPLIDQARELIEILEDHELELGDVLKRAFQLYLIDSIMRFVSSVAVTGLICWTVWNCLHYLK